MLRRTLIVCVISFIFISLIPLSIILDRKRSTTDLVVQHGVMDLASWDSTNNKKIRLDGEWSFYWNRLLTPQQFSSSGADRPIADGYMEVPSNWNGKRMAGISLPAYGYATYRMVLKNLPHSGVYALKKTNIRFSSTIYVNGHKLLEDGKPHQEAAAYEAGNIAKLSLFQAEKGSVEIIIQVANYDYINAGIPLSLYFGEEAAMIHAEQISMARSIAMIAILSTLALIAFICFIATIIYHKKDYTLLVFGLMCLFYALYHGLIGERSLVLFWPGIPFNLLYKVKDILSMTYFIMLGIMFYQLQRNVFSLKLTQTVTIVLGSCIFLVIFLPIRNYVPIYSYGILLYELIILYMLFKIAVLYMKSSSHNRTKSLLLFMVILCINLYSLDVILFAYSVKEDLWLGQSYFITYNLILIFLIVLRFFDAYQTIDEMSKQLIQLDRIKDDFLSYTSHELKTPLNAIVNITDTLLKGAEGPVSARQAHNLAIVMGSGRKLTQLVNELLDYSKMKHGDIVLFRSGLDLKATVDAIIGVHLFLLGGKRIAMVNGIPQGFPAVHADSNRLSQILHNLIGNAIKFTDEGTIAVSAEVIGDRVAVHIQDTGMGIAADMQERIFMAFEQAAATEAGASAGSGLGLSITKKLVELHNGEIQVESSPGQGARFTFTIPLANMAHSASVSGSASTGTSENAGAAAAARVELSLSNDGERLYDTVPFTEVNYPLYVKGDKQETILVVDDDFANLQTMINLFKLESYSIVVVNRGQLALDVLAQWTDLSLVVLDVMMPDKSGYEVLRTIRERFTPFELPVLMLTAVNRGGDTKLAMEYGANDFVEKPFESEELMARVSSLTRLKASVRSARNAEIAFLRSQINPHFVYNALNSIASLCLLEPKKAEQLTLEFAAYLRSSFDFKHLDSLTELANEMALVQAYVQIEKARFGSRLQVEYEVEARLDTLIPPLILQPLVENAIRHGLMSNMRGGTVTVSIKQQPNGATAFRVTDNGCGMSANKLEELLSPAVEKKGVGLWNIHQRIKLLYGTNIRVESSEGAGTAVMFDIPAQPVDQKGE